MGLRRVVSDGTNATRVVGQRIDGAGQAVAGETGRFNLGHGRGHESARAKFRPHLFHAQGRGVAGELRVVQPRECFASRIAGGRAKGFVARRRDGL